MRLRCVAANAPCFRGVRPRAYDASCFVLRQAFFFEEVLKQAFTISETNI